MGLKEEIDKEIVAMLCFLTVMVDTQVLQFIKTNGTH
jgi:hypothetical protein